MSKPRFKPQSWHASYVSPELPAEMVELLAQIRYEAIELASISSLMLNSPCDSNYATLLDHHRRLNSAEDMLRKARVEARVKSLATKKRR